MNDEPVSGARLVGACFVAAVAAPMPMAFALVGSGEVPAFALLSAMFFVTMFGAPIALLHVALLAVPTYLLLRRWRLGWWQAALAGMLIGSLPTALIFSDWGSAAMCGLCGLVGALTFWTVIRGGRQSGPPWGRDPLEQIFA
ncbi:MAG: hypothetical protein ACXWUX_16905 [Allosphingosinicella sp.]